MTTSALNEPPGARSPTAQDTTPDASVQPPLAPAKLAFAGSGSLRVTLRATEGPWFVTPIV